ncbi:unnamed protein product [Caenorhabditis auriculariae]|uniref:Uncharacterized protein n=1 Tax=Caenorhabditis auriculariae TaxID=2777116 RepID=A0A8S1HH55_9PELO|nr:unnamed protein product [Caenorhabditis auriculariae]
MIYTLHLCLSWFSATRKKNSFASTASSACPNRLSLFELLYSVIPIRSQLCSRCDHNISPTSFRRILDSNDVYANVPARLL